jgi:AraC-like DNA-binding protein
MADQHDHMPGPGAPPAFEMVERKPPAALAGLVSRITGYRETLPGHFRQVEAASLDVPLVVSFGEPFAIGLGRTPNGGDRHGSFAAGLFAGPVTIDSFGASHCVQVNFTPSGARRFFRLPMSELTNRMVALDDALGVEAEALRDALGDTASWGKRLDITEAFVTRRLAAGAAPCPEVAWAFGRIAASGGRAKVSSIAENIGWSRKHLARRFADEVGLGPKTVARIVRLNRAISAAKGGGVSWAGIAADCGYADQAHLVREFRELAGNSPVARMSSR